MSIYSPPQRYPSIFNPAAFTSSATSSSSSSGSGNYLTSTDAESTYAKLAGGQTIVAAETFTGGITTDGTIFSNGTLKALGGLYVDDIYPATVNQVALNGDVTVGGTLSVTDTSSLAGVTLNGNVTQGSAYTTALGATTITGNISQSSGYSTTLRTTTISGTASITRMILSSDLNIGSHIIWGSSWTASTLSSSTGTYSYTISVSSITSGDFTGQIYISVKNTTTASLLSQLNYFLVKANGTLTVTGTSSAPNNFGTYTLNSVSTNKLTVSYSNASIVVSTYTTSSSVCWYFIGAVV